MSTASYASLDERNPLLPKDSSLDSTGDVEQSSTSSSSTVLDLLRVDAEGIQRGGKLNAALFWALLIDSIPGE